MTALLVVQGTEAQIHGAVLDHPGEQPVAGRTQALIDLWERALAGSARPPEPGSGDRPGG